MGVYLWEEGPYPSVTETYDLSGTSSYLANMRCGICISAKVNCTISKVGLGGLSTGGIILIAQGTSSTSYDESTKVEYTMGQFTTEFELPTPYEMEGGKSYIILQKGSGPFYVSKSSDPIEGTNVILSYGIFGVDTDANRMGSISSITTAQSGINAEEKELLNAYIGERVDVTSLTLDKSSISLTTIGQTEQITATTVPAGATVNWSSDDTTVATVSSSGLVTCVTPGTCTITATTVNGLTATCEVSNSSYYFNFGDWTNSQWTFWYGAVGTITKTSTYISFSNSSGYSGNYLSQYEVDGTRDFLLEFNGNIPNTSQSDHSIGLVDINSSSYINFWTDYESAYRDKIQCNVNGSKYSGETNPGTADYFIKKEGNVLTMGWGGVTKYTNNNFTFASSYYLCEKVYRDTLTINTARLTYL